jgi:hypothetical protein
MHLLVGSWNFSHASSLAAATSDFVADHLLGWILIATHWEHFLAWLEQPRKSPTRVLIRIG